MKNFRVALEEVANPYLITHPHIGLPLYDYGVCGVLENYLYECMDNNECSASFSYLDFACDGESVQGCMTITIMPEDFLPEVYIFLYENDLRTCSVEVEE